MPDADDDVGSMGRHALRQEVVRLRHGIRAHRDAKGNDRCWIDDAALYALLPEDLPADTRLPPKEEFLRNCEKFFATRQCPLSSGD